MFWKASLETSAFNFDAFGMTKTQAKAALQNGWEEHCRQNDDIIPFEDREDGVRFLQFRIGECYRDDDDIRRQP